MAQEKTEKTSEKLDEGKVRPTDDIVVYTTKAVISIYPKIGTPVKLHKEQAAKWIDSGKATKQAPKESNEPAKPAKKLSAADQKKADEAASAGKTGDAGDDKGNEDLDDDDSL